MASSNPNSFNSYEQQQQPDKNYNTSQFSNFTSPSSNNTSTQSVAGSTPHLSSKESPSFNLLQTLLKPQPPTSVADLEKPFGNTPGRAVSSSTSATGIVSSSSPPVQGTSNPIDQLKRMMLFQSSYSSGTKPGGINFETIEQPQLRSFSNASMSRANEMSPIQAKSLSVQSSPPLSNASEVIVGPPAIAARKSGITSGGGTPSSNSKAKTTIDKKTRLQNLVIDVKKVKINAKPETVLISILQQPARFRPGRLISVSREYICYAVRSKEGGRIRVIHQLQGQLAKMVGHTDSIIDMAFHPCSSSKDPNMPQILASLGKDDRLIVWLVGPVDLEAGSAEGAISYEPFINVESGGDARFTCLAWREQIVDESMELCVGTDKGFMIVKAPMPTSSLTNGVDNQAVEGGGGSSELGENLSITPVDTTYAVTAIERAGLRWVFTATADHSINLYELDSHWETCSQPYRHVCRVTKCDHSVDTLVYIAPITAADGAGHLIIGHSMNKQIQLWWLGNSANQISLLQTLTFAGIGTQKPAQVFSKLAWSEQCRCLTISSSHAPSAMFVLHPNGSGSDMYFSYPQGYSLGDDSLTLSMVAAEEQSQDEENSNSIPSSGGGATSLSIYGVHTRLVQQLQIDGIKPAPAKVSNLPDPSDVYNGNAKATVTDGYVRLSSQQPPGGDEGAPSVSVAPTTQAARVAEPKKPKTATNNSGIDMAAELKKTIDTAVSAQVQSAMAELKLESSRQAKSNDVGGKIEAATISLDKGAESELVDRISAEVERRVTKSMSTVMEQTLIPAYNRATAAMFEQMQSTFEAGLREWWMRFAQMVPPPPPHPHHPMAGGTPLSHGVMMPQPQPQPQPQQQNQTVTASGPSSIHDSIMSLMGNNIGMQQKSPMAQQSPPQSMSMSMSMSMAMPRPASNLSSTNATAGSNHIESLRNILNFQQQQQQQQQQPMALMDPAIAALGERTNTPQGASTFPSK